MAQCPNCCLDLSLHAPVDGGYCPNCGRKYLGELAASNMATAEGVVVTPAVAPVGPGASAVLFHRFWSTLKDVILRPGQFYSREAANIVTDDGLSTALAFAVIVQWLASFFNFIWRSTVGVVLERRMDDLFRIATDVMEANQGPGLTDSLEQMRSRAVEFLFGAGAIVLTPFTTLLKLAFVGIFVHAAVRFFTKEEPGRPHSYNTTLKILAYATAPWILCIIPGFGMLLGWILAFSAAVIGIREVYRTTTGRAVLAVAFPELLFMAFLFGIAVLVLLLAFNVLRLVF